MLTNSSELDMEQLPAAESPDGREKDRTLTGGGGGTMGKKNFS